MGSLEELPPVALIEILAERRAGSDGALEEEEEVGFADAGASLVFRLLFFKSCE